MAELEGLTELITAMANQVDNVYEVTEGALADAADLVKYAIQTSLSLTSHPPGTPTPSMPGEPPSLVSTALRESVRVEPSGGDEGRWGIEIGPTTVYARIQELGGISGRGHRTVLPPRPYVKPSLAASHDLVVEMLAEAWADAIDI